MANTQKKVKNESWELPVSHRTNLSMPIPSIHSSTALYTYKVTQPQPQLRISSLSPYINVANPWLSSNVSLCSSIWGRRQEKKRERVRRKLISSNSPTSLGCLPYCWSLELEVWKVECRRWYLLLCLLRWALLLFLLLVSSLWHDMRSERKNQKGIGNGVAC